MARGFIVVALLAVSLAACDARRIEKLEEGFSTESDVRAQFGEPTLEQRLGDGSLRLEYTRQPEGHVNYEIVIGPDGKMASLRQLLTPANFARLQAGATQAQVRQALGAPGKVQAFPLKSEEVWEWRFLDGQESKLFWATFDKDGRLTTTTTVQDPRHTAS